MASDSSAVTGEPACCPPSLSRPVLAEQLGLAEQTVATEQPRLRARPVLREQTADLAQAFRALAEPARLALLSALASSESGELCGCDLTGPLGLSQPTVSHHLKVLTQAGLITRTQRGTWAWFRIVPTRFAELAAVLSDLGSMGLLEAQAVEGPAIEGQAIEGQAGVPV